MADGRAWPGFQLRFCPICGAETGTHREPDAKHGEVVAYHDHDEPKTGVRCRFGQNRSWNPGHARPSAMPAPIRRSHVVHASEHDRQHGDADRNVRGHGDAEHQDQDGDQDGEDPVAFIMRIILSRPPGPQKIRHTFQNFTTTKPQ
jgi:hypothetical protein